MKPVKIYTTSFCGYCEMAKRLLKNKNIPFVEEKISDDDTATWTRLEKQTGFKTMPQIFIDEIFIGGYRELANLETQGKLDALLL